MSTLAATHPTLMDLKSRLDASGNVIPVIEMLSQTNEIIEDAVFLEANELTGHTTSVRTGIPEPTWRKLYGGVQPSKTTSVKVREGLGMLENYAEVDKSLADLNNNSAAWRLSEEQGIIEGFGQKLARYMIYGNEATEPEGFTGLAPRFNDQAAVNWMTETTYALSNDKAVAMMPPDVASKLPTSPGMKGKFFEKNFEWWGANGPAVSVRFQQLIAS